MMPDYHLGGMSQHQQECEGQIMSNNSSPPARLQPVAA